MRRHDLVPATPVSELVLGPGKPLAFYTRPFLRWLIDREMSPATVRSYEDALNAFVEFCERHGIRSPDDVRAKTVERFLAWLRQDRKLSAQTTNHRRYALTTLWRFLIREEVVTTNVAASAYGLRLPKRIADFLTPAEQRRVLEGLVARARRQSRYWESPRRRLLARRDFVIVAVLLLAGLRASELCNLTVGHIDLESGVLKVVDGKGRKDRMVPLVPWLGDVLRWYLRDVRPALVGDGGVDAVFVSHRGTRPLDARALWSIVRRSVSPIVGRPVHPHTLRHSFASKALDGGGNLVGIGMAMGHSDPRTTAIYTHIPAPEYRARLTSWLAAGLDHIAGPWSGTPGAATSAAATPGALVPPPASEGPVLSDAQAACFDRAARERLRQLRRSRRKVRP